MARTSKNPNANPIFVESGRRGAMKRWKGGRIARLDDLDAPTKAVVLALIAAARAAKSEPTLISSQVGSVTPGGTTDAPKES